MLFPGFLFSSLFRAALAKCRSLELKLYALIDVFISDLFAYLLQNNLSCVKDSNGHTDRLECSVQINYTG